jgi:multidrug efflux pump subunit AcrB
VPDGSFEPAGRRGPLAWMTRNSVAANLLMLVLVVGGLFASLRLKQEVFPEFDLDTVEVRVVYPGASPEEVEQGILLSVQEAVRGLDGVKRVDAEAREGVGTISVLLLLGADPDTLHADVKAEVDRITTFPEEAEKPEVTIGKNRRQVISVIISGPHDLRTLHDLAERARADLLALDEVTQVELEGVPPLEIAIEVPRENLEKYGLDLQTVANTVAAASLELPAGSLETTAGQILVRVADRRRLGHELRDVVVRRTSTGAQIRLSEIANIVDDYEDIDQYSLFDGEPAVRLTAYRVGDETPTSVARAVRDYAEQLEGQLPESVKIHIWEDDSEVLRDRVDLLLNNAAIGLVLVLLILALFLDLRLAFWVGLGIPISFLGALFLLSGTDVSINMISLFAFIVTLGMVVDDAIVVGERVFTKREEGLPPVQAAIEAAREMAMPVTFAILTTIAAFSPLFFVPGTMGKIFNIIPFVVVAVLILSLIESFFVLPAHLAHSKGTQQGGRGPIAAVQRRVRAGLRWVIERLYRPAAGLAVKARYFTLAIALGLLMLTAGFVVSGKLPFNFFPSLEGDVVRAEVRMPYGTSVETTKEISAELERAAQAAIEERGGSTYVRGMFTRMGQAAPRRGPGAGAAESGGHIVSIELSLVPNDQRTFRADEMAETWQEQMPPVPGAESVSFDAASGPGAGAAVAVQLMHTDQDVLAAASQRVASILSGYDSLRNVRNDYAQGKPQIDFRLRPEARALGLTASDVARQIRASFHGAEALREQRGRNEVKIVARLPKGERSSEDDLRKLRIRTPAGGHVPLAYVADAERGRAATSIQHEDGVRRVSVTAELGYGVASPREVLTNLQDHVFPRLQQEFPGLRIATVGQQREQAETFAALGQNYALAMFVIFALLAIPFRSYVQPIVVMAVIPFGFIGAVAGHALLGYGLSIMSMFGLVALSGVVVNDSLVLIDATNGLRAKGLSAREAIMEAGVLRFRPILLTSLTTFFGLVPMIFETSVQAQFLIPMAISLGFGVLFVTVIVLLVVPALYVIVEELRDFVLGHSASR